MKAELCLLLCNFFFFRKLAYANADLHSVDMNKVTLYDTKGNRTKPFGDVRYLPNFSELLETAPESVPDKEQNER